MFVCTAQELAGYYNFLNALQGWPLLAPETHICPGNLHQWEYLLALVHRTAGNSRGLVLPNWKAQAALQALASQRVQLGLFAIYAVKERGNVLVCT